MAIKLIDIEGVTSEIEAALKAEGITTSDQLLEAAGQPKPRAELAAKLGLEVRALLEIANRADLGRLTGVGRVYSDLLEWAGIDTVMELRRRKADNLHKKIEEAAVEHSVKRTPRLDEVESWVEQAKALDRAIHY